MRSVFNRDRAIAVIAMVLTLTASAPVAEAQGFFQQLFGLTPKPPAPIHNPNYPQASVRMLPPGFVHQAPRASLRRSPLDDRDLGDAPRSRDRGTGGATYRTLCVRLCDGYYWPVSNTSTRSTLTRDARVCSSSCGEEARLFYISSNNGQIDDAVDLHGRVYSKLPTAFRYRKSLIDGCACRPAPWSDQEASRHLQYAMAEEARKPKPVAVVPAQPENPQQRLSFRQAQDIGLDQPNDALDRQVGEPSKRDAATGPAVIAEPAPAPTPPTSRSRPVRVADAGEPKPRAPRQVVVPARLVARPAVLNAPAAPPVLGGFGPAKYTWPGDAVRR